MPEYAAKPTNSPGDEAAASIEEASASPSLPASGFGQDLRAFAAMALTGVLALGCASQETSEGLDNPPAAKASINNDELSRRRDQASLASEMTGRPLRDFNPADRVVDEEQYMVMTAADGGTQALAAYGLYLDTAVIFFDKDAKVAAATVMTRWNVEHTLARVTTDMVKQGAEVANMEAWIIGGLVQNDAQEHNSIKAWLNDHDVELRSYTPRVRHHGDPIFNVALSLTDGTLYEVMPTKEQLSAPHKYRDGAPLVKLSALHEGDLLSGRLTPGVVTKVAPVEESIIKNLPAALYDPLMPTVLVNQYMLAGGKGNQVQAIATYSVTDCIAVGMWDPTTGKGALIHFRSNAAGKDNLERVSEDLRASGANIETLQIAVAGGSNQVQRGKILSAELYAAIHEWAKMNQHPIVQDTGLSKDPYYHLQYSLENGQFYTIEPKSFERHSFTPDVPQRIFP